MRAAVYFGRQDVRSTEWTPPPPPPPGWVQVAVSWCGICGTDLEEIVHGPMLVPTEPHPLTGRQLPLVLGHEGTGRVVAAGDGAGIDPGVRVGMENSVSCGRCTACRRGQFPLCEQMAVLGLMLDGALAECVNVPASTCVAIPEGIPDEWGAINEPLSVAVRAVRRGGVAAGDDVQIFGGGTVGVLAAQVARAAGARRVVVREPSPPRRAIAEACGLEGLPPDQERHRSDVVIECSGAAAGVEAALAATAKSGTTVIVGVHTAPVPIDLHRLVLDERSIVASLSHSLEDDYRPAMELLAERRITVDPLITDRVSLDRVVDEGFRRLLDEPSQHVKVLVRCGG